jgi:hypothetical protein
MWCFRIRTSFRKLIEYNPTFFSKNEYIHMTERLYEDGKFRSGRCIFYIYCIACNFLVFICDNTEKYADKYLNECITKTEESVLHIIDLYYGNEKVKKHLVIMKLVRFIIIFILDTEKALNFIVLVLQKKLRKVLHIN